jgi:hypothetical protein
MRPPPGLHGLYIRLHAKCVSNKEDEKARARSQNVFSGFFMSLMKTADRDAWSIGVLIGYIAAVTGCRERLVAGDVVLFHAIVRFLAGKAGLTTGKTRLTNRNRAVI